MTARLHSLRHQEKKSAGSSSVSGNSSSSSNNINSNGSSNHRQHHHQQSVHQGPSPAPSPSPSLSPSPKHSDGRRANKPLMEKRRRARINQSLAALKALILDSARLENTKHSKLEKADILELTVRHLQRQRSLAQPGLSRYKAGYQDCSREVSRYLDAPEIITGNTTPMDPAVKQRLLRHLDSCVSELDLDLGSRPDSGLGSSPGSVTDRVTGATSPGPLEHHVPPTAHCSTALNPASLIKSELPDMEATRPDSSTTAGDENNNSSRPTSAFGQINPTSLDPHHPSAGIPVDQASTSQQNPNMLSVVQVIPSRLPDGQVVFLLPSHYVQLAAAAAANGISIGPNPPTAIWAATNMSLLKATDKLAKRPHDEIQEWQDAAAAAVSAAAAAVAASTGTATVTASGTTALAAVNVTTATTVAGSGIGNGTGNGNGNGIGIGSGATVGNGSTLASVAGAVAKPSKSPRIEQPEQPLDFTTTSKKLKIASRNSMHSVTGVEHHLQQPQLLQLPSSRISSEGSMIHEERPSSHGGSELGAGIRSPSPLAQQPVKDEEGMWRPW